MNKQNKVLPGLLLICALVTGCGTTMQQAKSQQRVSLQFKDLTHQHVITPDSKVDPKAATDLYKDVSVVDEHGHHVTLDASRQPILFVAYWCPHCQRTLQLLTLHRSKLGQLPVVVNLGYPKGTTLRQAVNINTEEHKQLLLTSFQTYYALSAAAPDTYAPQGYPTLAYADKSGYHTLYGEHTLSVWEQILHSAQ